MKRSIETAPACPWCGRPFQARRGGSPQRFCCGAHRMAFWSALRRWAERAVGAGALTVDHVKSGLPSACTLLPGGNSPASKHPPKKPASLAPAARPDEAAKLLLALLAVQSEGWHALATAMSDELFERLKRWQAAGMAAGLERR